MALFKVIDNETRNAKPVSANTPKDAVKRYLNATYPGKKIIWISAKAGIYSLNALISIGGNKSLRIASRAYR